MNPISAAAVLLLGVTAASAQSLDDLKSDGRNTDHILTYGMGYHQQRYSPLKQINKNTVKRLVPVWALSLANEVGEQGQPLVDAVTRGKNQMPAWGDLLKPEEVEALWAYVISN